MLKQETPDQDKAVFDVLVFLLYGDDPFKVKQIPGMPHKAYLHICLVKILGSFYISLHLIFDTQGLDM